MTFGGRILALDLGRKRIGLALSDELGFTAQGMETMDRVGRRDDGDYDAVTSVAVYRTVLDGGSTSLFALGKYYDVVRVEAGRACFLGRTLRLETRELGLGTHFPL